MSVTGLAGTELGAGRWTGTGRGARGVNVRRRRPADGRMGRSMLAGV